MLTKQLDVARSRFEETNGDKGRTDLQVFDCGLDQLETSDLETSPLEAADDFSYEFSLDAIGLDHDIAAFFAVRVRHCGYGRWAMARWSKRCEEGQQAGHVS